MLNIEEHSNNNEKRIDCAYSDIGHIISDIKSLNEESINSKEYIANTTDLLRKRVSHNEESIDVLHKTIENVVHIGTDVDANRTNHGGSWAVVCIEGKMNIVKFVDLSRGDIRHVLDFLKQFEAAKHCIDMPYLAFKEELFKF